MPKAKSNGKRRSDGATRRKEASKPCTPARKRWLDILKPAIALGKRVRSNSNTTSQPIALPPRPSEAPYQHAHHSPPHICVALQTDDPDPASDAIIITALPRVPFCCHADLLRMARPALLAVAHALNARLPAALHIPAGPTRTDADVRADIEVLVGIRQAVPMAPKATRTYEARSPPPSPLANKSRSQDLYGVLGSPPLARLEEEEEPMAIDRPMKRRRVSGEQDSPTPAPKPRIVRTQSQTANRAAVRMRAAPAQRSMSVDMGGGKTRTVDLAFVTTARPRYRFRPALGTRKVNVLGEGSMVAEMDAVSGGAWKRKRLPGGDQEVNGTDRMNVSVSSTDVSMD